MRILFAVKMLEDHFYPPLGVCYLSAALKARGHETAIVDAVNERAVLAAIAEHRPGLLGVSTMTPRYPFFRDLAPKVKAAFPDLPIVFGGHHAIADPNVIEAPGVDAVCLDEGERAFANLADRLEAGEAYWETRGFWVRRDGRVFRNAVEPLIADLDSLPFADFHLTDGYPYCRGARHAGFIASRGCPYNCEFCLGTTQRQLHAGEGPPVRRRSPASVVEEIRRRKQEYRLDFVFFFDSIFGLRLDDLAELMALYRRDVGLPFWCLLHPLVVTAERARLIAEGGGRIVALGVETGSEEVRGALFRRRYPNEAIVRAIDLIHRRGMVVQTTNMLGIPGAGLDADFETLDLNIRARADIPDASVYLPFPGTNLERALAARGLTAKRGDYWPYIVLTGSNAYLSKRHPHPPELMNFALLFAPAVKSPWIRRHLPALIKSPFRFPLVAISRLTALWLKFRHFGRYLLRPNLNLLRMLAQYFKL